jgi:PPOX class probable F420-dependent enzyme
MSEVLPSGSFGERVARRLRDERVIWLSTVGADGTPQPNPVWFLWEEPATLLIYNRRNAHRLAHIGARPNVSLNFDGDGKGGDIVVVLGVARVVDSRPLPHQHSSYRAKYETAMTRVGGSVEKFSAEYPVAMEVAISRIRGF